MPGFITTQNFYQLVKKRQGPDNDYSKWVMMLMIIKLLLHLLLEYSGKN